MLNNYILTENLTNTVVLYILLKKLMEDFEQWDAFKLGIIDKNGKKLKEPTSSKEREAWDLLTRFCWNFKKILQRFIGKSKLGMYLSAAFLLKDSLNHFVITHNQKHLNESYLYDMTFEKQKIIMEFIEELSKNYQIEKITEDNFEYQMFKIMPKVDIVLEKFDFNQVV